ncbi:MAG: hypothetical protein A2V77_02365 [Anaeromyxobacter sp. RBG_16_69_14]|nr:MAG: hypothetical protein A2V77_02365 [Anaeromyxobacter sp. RBG_16_69_14]
MREWLVNLPRLPQWCEGTIGGGRLSPEDAAVFLAAALVLIPPELELRASLMGDAPASEELRDALRGLWLRSGMAPPAPVSMPLHQLSPGLFALGWRRLRAALAQAFRIEME